MKYGLRIPSFALGPKTATLEQMGRYLRRAEELKFEAAVTIDHLLLTPPAYATTWLEPLSMLCATWLSLLVVFIYARHFGLHRMARKAG